MPHKVGFELNIYLFTSLREWGFRLGNPFRIPDRLFDYILGNYDLVYSECIGCELVERKGKGIRGCDSDIGRVNCCGTGGDVEWGLVLEGKKIGSIEWGQEGGVRGISSW